MIVERQVAILGIGRIRKVPGFGDNGELIEKQVVNFSWACDHRVIDGMTSAKAGKVVQNFLEDPDLYLTLSAFV